MINDLQAEEITDGDNPSIRVREPESQRGLRVEIGDFCINIYELEGENPAATVNFYDVKGLVRACAGILLESVSDIPEKAKEKEMDAIFSVLQKPMMKNLSKASDEVLEIHSRVFDATEGKYSGAEKWPEFYEEKELRKEVQEHRGAAVAAACVELLFEEFQQIIALDFNPPLKEVIEKCREIGKTITVNFRGLAGPSRKELSKVLRQWPTLFSSTGEIYPELQKTVMNIGSDLPVEAILDLNKVRLPRPIFDDLELAAATYRPRLWRLPTHERIADSTADFGLDSANGEILRNSKREDIIRASQLFQDYRGESLDLQDSGDLGQFLHFLWEFPQKVEGDILDLARQAIKQDRCEDA